MAAVDYFMKIDGIEGESTDEAHKGAVNVESFSFGVTQTGSFGGGGGGGAGKAQFQDLHFTSKTSKASPKLFLACASGEHIKKAQLFCRKAGGEQQPFEFMKVTFTDVLVSSYQTGGSGDQPSKSLSLNFAKVEFIWFEQSAAGTAGSVVSAGWDIKANKKL